MASDEIYLTYLNALDVKALNLTDQEILDAVEQGLRAQGEGATVIEPRVHLTPDPAFRGHFNVLRGYVAPLDLAGVKIVGDFVENYQRGLPSEMALLNLFDPRTGMPRAIMDATAITEMRTGALTALGARHLAKPGSRVLGHIGARGTAYWNVRLLDRLGPHNLHGELCELVTGAKPGRQDDAETNLFWHRGLSLSDIALGAAILAKAHALGVGQQLRFA